MASLSPGEVETIGQDYDWGGLVTGGVDLVTSIWGKSTAPTTTIIQTGMPPWVLPVSIGGVGILALSIFAVTKKKRR